LLRHAWDSSHQMFWCDPEDGRSAHAWGRAMGWYVMALVDVIEILPAGEQQDALVRILNSCFQAIPLFADQTTGMWYQVLDRPYAEGNYLEATASAMFVYAMLKGSRLGVLAGITQADACQGYDALLATFVRVDEDGLVNLDHCCEMAGLGGKGNRSGDYDYYINEPVRSNDPKGIGPLIWAALEYERI
ncbi:MAG: glycoside hydrolase family 88 protein, partial [Bacteroidales bacterium]|nr:glycoside hydrolase family 88 protein [Bacteroidales bacterium]